MANNELSKSGDRMPAAYEGERKHTSDWRVRTILVVIAVLVAGALLSVILGALKYTVDVIITIVSVCAVLVLGIICGYYGIRYHNEKNRRRDIEDRYKAATGSGK